MFAPMFSLSTLVGLVLAVGVLSGSICYRRGFAHGCREIQTLREIQSMWEPVAGFNISAENAAARFCAYCQNAFWDEQPNNYCPSCSSMHAMDPALSPNFDPVDLILNDSQPVPTKGRAPGPPHMPGYDMCPCLACAKDRVSGLKVVPLPLAPQLVLVDSDEAKLILDKGPHTITLIDGKLLVPHDFDPGEELILDTSQGSLDYYRPNAPLDESAKLLQQNLIEIGAVDQVAREFKMPESFADRNVYNHQHDWPAPVIEVAETKLHSDECQCESCQKDTDDSKLLWCNVHQRPAEECKTGAGIMLPCRTVDLTGIAEIHTLSEEELEKLSCGPHGSPVEEKPTE